MNASTKLLLDCAADGLTAIEEHLRAHPATYFDTAGFNPSGMKVPRDVSFLFPPDTFYPLLSARWCNPRVPRLGGIFRAAPPKAQRDNALNQIEGALYRETEFDRALAETIQVNAELDDPAIRARFMQDLKVHSVDILSLPVEQSLYFAKVNHGYWEYMLSAYDPAHFERGRFRRADIALRKRRLRTSGVTSFWGYVLARLHGAETSRSGQSTVFCVSLTNGIARTSVSIQRELSPETRGAAVGMISFFEALRLGQRKVPVGDGGATRRLILDGTLSDFHARFVQDSGACVFVVPPHLARIGLVDFKGATYRFVLPGKVVNETWKLVAASLVGYLKWLAGKHGSITVLSQGASIGSLMALLLADLDVLKGVRVRYFDLGRVLDVAVPEVFQTQPWAARRLDEYLAIGRKVFSLEEVAGTADDIVPLLTGPDVAAPG
jgi:hypothetical protein